MTVRRPLAAALGLSAALLASACAADGGGTATPGPGTEPPSTTTTTSRPGPLDDQTPPRTTFGLAWDQGTLWVADYDGGQVIAVDPETGAILVRWKGSDGVTTGIDDVTVGPDGSLYWTGFDDGSVDRMYQGNFVPIAGLEPGMNGLALSDDERLYATRADEGTKAGGDGLWEIDPQGQKRPRLIAEEIGNVNGIDVGPDGLVYGARKGKGPGDGTLVTIDPGSGAVTELVGGFHSPVAVKLSADHAKAYVLSSVPPVVHVVDLATKAVTEHARPGTTFVNNLVVAPDGRVFVSALDEPVLTVIAPDGTTRTLHIGRADTSTSTTAPT